MGRRALVVILGLVLAVVFAIKPAITDTTEHPVAEDPSTDANSAKVKQYPVTLRYPASSPGVATGLVDAHGQSITVACEVCHSLQEKSPVAEELGLASLEDFHQGLVLEHGSLTCYSCHDREDTQSFRLANGAPVEKWDVIELCSQCHGPQRKDFDHGAHGGMTGYWDLTRGPRTRNACTTCHSAHAPKPGMVQPTFKPIDRFLVGSDPDMHSEGKDSDHD